MLKDWWKKLHTTCSRCLTVLKCHSCALILPVLFLTPPPALSPCCLFPWLWNMLCFSLLALLIFFSNSLHVMSVWISLGLQWEQNVPCTWKTSLWMPMHAHWSLAAVSGLCAHTQPYIHGRKITWTHRTNSHMPLWHSINFQLEARPRHQSLIRDDSVVTAVVPEELSPYSTLLGPARPCKTLEGVQRTDLCLSKAALCNISTA